MDRRTTRTVSFFAFGFLVLAVVLAGRGREPSVAAGAAPVAVARVERLDVTLVEGGSLAAARSITLASEIRSNRAKIVSLVGDGTWVEPEAEVVRFDVTPFEEERQKILGELREAEATAERLHQEKKLQIAKAEETLESARHRARLAELSLASFEQGSGAIQLREVEVRADEVRAELDRAQAELADLESMFDRGFVSAGELERARTKVGELARRSGLEAERFAATREVVFPRDLERARIDVREAREAIARAEAVAYHTREFYEAAVAGADRKTDQVRERLRIADEELRKTVIRAPIAGFVVLQDIPLESGRRRPQVGDSVWSGQPIATIPDLSQMVVHARVREIDLHRISLGLPATVGVEAYPDLALNGRVEHVGNLAESDASSPWKFFSVRLVLDRSDPRLRPGMSVRVAFRLGSSRGGVVVPRDAVFPRGAGHVVYLERGREVWERPVVLGLENDTHVVVQRGLEAGDRLRLERPQGEVRRSVPSAPAA